MSHLLELLGRGLNDDLGLAVNPPAYEAFVDNRFVEAFTQRAAHAKD